VHPILHELHVFGMTRPIGGYGLMVALGVLATGILVGRAAHRAREDVGAVIATIGYTAAASFAGAWLFFLFVELVRAGGDLSEALSRGGGLVFYGAIPAGAIASYLAARGLGVPYWKMLDLSIPGIAVGHALGRVGCFLGGCCYGYEWHGPWAVTATDERSPMAHPSVPRHPVQLYESVGLVLLALLFAAVPPTASWLGKPGTGQRAASYLVLYGLLRFCTEAFRGDGIRGVFFGGLLSTSQIVSLVGIALGLTWSLWSRRRDAAQRPAEARG
jgi:phosphatidylglycerol:prolipoprotein diacylglycerol transferase